MASRSPRSATSNGSITPEATARSSRTTPTSPQQSSKPSTTVKQNPPSRRLPNLAVREDRPLPNVDAWVVELFAPDPGSRNRDCPC